MSELSEIGKGDQNDDEEVSGDHPTSTESNSVTTRLGISRTKSHTELFGQLLKIEVDSRSKWIRDAVSVVPAKSWELL